MQYVKYIVVLKNLINYNVLQFFSKKVPERFQKKNHLLNFTQDDIGDQPVFWLKIFSPLLLLPWTAKGIPKTATVSDGFPL